MQLALAMRRRSLTSELRAPSLECSATVRNRILRRFPFELTGDQRRVMDVIAGDMARQFPMNRLLQGDVGSGKTVVAIFAMLVAVAGEHQATLMAPTEDAGETALRDAQADVGGQPCANRIAVRFAWRGRAT